MNKTKYLEQKEVGDFVAWLSTHLGSDSKLGHFYDLPGGIRVEFSNLADALKKYDWNFRVEVPGTGRHEGRKFEENTAALAKLQKLLIDAEQDKVDGDARMVAAATAVMQWGGVMNGNAAWLKRNQNGLVQQVRQVAARLREDDEDREAFPADLRFNAGMTKVYSLLVQPFIIYDSRVAGALAWFVMQWMDTEKKRYSSVPDALNFPCMPAKEAEGAKLRKLRNPGTGKRQFQAMQNRPKLHAQWNLRATWILEAALASQLGSPFHKKEDALRALEAALFMWGYDLGKNSPWLNETKDVDENGDGDGDGDAPDTQQDAPMVSRCTQRLKTLGVRALDFGWYFDEENDSLVISRANGWVDSYMIGELFQALHLLYDQFEYGSMPLANNVMRLGNGTERPGLGSTLMTMLRNKRRAQGVSYLAPILVALNIFEWNGQRLGMEFSFSVHPPASMAELRDQLSEFA